MPLPSFYSQAGNFLSTLQGGVDPRTGLFNVSLPLVNLHSGNLAGPAFALSLQYSPLLVQNEGFGRGFSLNLTRYDKATGRLVLSTGEIYHISSSGDSVRQKKLRNFLFRKIDDSHCVVIHKSGLTEHLSRYDFVYVPVLITTPEGRSLKLTWGSTYNPVRLLKIEDVTLYLQAYQKYFVKMPLQNKSKTAIFKNHTTHEVYVCHEEPTVYLVVMLTTLNITPQWARWISNRQIKSSGMSLTFTNIIRT